LPPQPIRHGGARRYAAAARRGWRSDGHVHVFSRRPRVMAARRISRRFEDLWNSDGSRGLERPGVARAAEAGDADAEAVVVSTDRPPNAKLGLADADAAASKMAEASLGGGDGRFSAWLMRASHLDAGSLSSITRTLPALRGTTSWNLHVNCVVK